MNINQVLLQQLVSEPYFSRGKEYFKLGQIKLTRITPDVVNAYAVGSCVYSVILIHKNMQLNGRCSCPSFRDFGPCKHMAATGLAVIEHLRSGYKTSQDSSDMIDEFANFEKQVKSKTKQELVEYIFMLAQDYPDIMYDF